MASVMIEVDDRGRMSLPKALRPEGGGRYLGELLPDGDVLLRRAVVVPAVELAMLRDPEIEGAFARVEEALGGELV